MPKLKTKSAVKKRFKVTGNGGVKVTAMGKRHGMIKRSAKFIRNARGKYLARDANGLFFTDDRSTAMVFDYREDSVPEQLEYPLTVPPHRPR